MAGWSALQTRSGNAIIAGTTGTTLAFSSNITAGNVLVICSNYPVSGSSFTPTYSDTKLHTWNDAGHALVGNQNGAIGWTVATSSGADTLKIVWSSATSANLEIYIGEFIPPSGTVSQDGSSVTGTPAGTATNTPAGNGTGNNDLMLTTVGCTSTFSSFAGTWNLIGTALNGDAAGYSLNSAGNLASNINQSPSGTFNVIMAGLQAIIPTRSLLAVGT